MDIAALQSFSDWLPQQTKFNLQKPWLLLGKGPSFAKRTAIKDLHEYITVGLNHVVREQKVDFLHLIDLEVVRDCAESLYQNAGYVIMPWRPHIRHRPFNISKKIRFYPSDVDLAEYCRRIPVLQRLAAEGRVLWYNLASSHRPPAAGSPIIHATAFSATAVLNLLTVCGIKKVFTLGIDGGSAYNPNFADLEKTTKLQTGQASYDLQFRGFAETIQKTGVYFAPLDWQHPVAVTLRRHDGDALAAQVLQFSIRKNTSLTVQFSNDAAHTTDRHIEIDTHQFVAQDLRSFWSAGIKELAKAVPLENFSSAASRPWIYSYAPAGRIWTRTLLQALDCGAISRQTIDQEIAAGHVRPSLAVQIDKRIVDAYNLPRSTVEYDKAFLTEHHTPLPSFSLLYRLLAVLRAPWQNARVVDLAQKLANRNLSDPVEYADIAFRMLRKLFPAYIRLE